MAIFTNQAILSYSGGTVNSNLVTGEIAEAVTATKTAVSASYTPGGTGFAPLGLDAEITNTVTVDGPSIVTPLSATATIGMEMEPQLSITKAVSPEVVTGSDELTYTFVIQNFGSEADATDQIVITDVFDPILTDLTVTLDGVPLGATDYSYDETTGLFTTLVGRITVPAATFTQNPEGTWMTPPGVTTLTVAGTIG